MPFPLQLFLLFLLEPFLLLLSSLFLSLLPLFEFLLLIFFLLLRLPNLLSSEVILILLVPDVFLLKHFYQVLNYSQVVLFFLVPLLFILLFDLPPHVPYLPLLHRIDIGPIKPFVGAEVIPEPIELGDALVGGLRIPEPRRFNELPEIVVVVLVQVLLIEISLLLLYLDLLDQVSEHAVETSLLPVVVAYKLLVVNLISYCSYG